jgi:hypothetical protein
VKRSRRTLEIYVEGGGKSNNHRAELRAAFLVALRDLKKRAADAGWTLHPIFLGPGPEAFKRFVKDSPAPENCHRLLLIDAEGPVTGRVGDHLSSQFHWNVSGLDPNDMHLMVQCMEVWFLADVEALKSYFGTKINLKKLPDRKNLEEEPKQDCLAKLEAACKPTPSGTYGKGEHSSGLLKLINWSSVCASLHHANRFNARLEAIISPPTAAE